jgi:ferric-dicitrate binding protein FerR (iron transport regulator)
MSQPRTDLEQRARESLETLATPRVDPAFRGRLRSDFVSGRITAARLRPALPPAVRLWPVALPLAAAAALLVVFAINRGPAYTLSAASGEGIVVVDGLPIPILHRDDLSRRLKPGARVRVPEGAELEITSPGSIAFQVAGGTDVALPRSPGRWFGRTARAEVRSGELRISTGPRFHGARLEIETPEAALTVTGTTLAVICEQAGTCVCVLDGRVAVGRKGEVRVMVRPGQRRYIFNDDRRPENDVMRPGEQVALTAFREKQGR